MKLTTAMGASLFSGAGNLTLAWHDLIVQRSGAGAKRDGLRADVWGEAESGDFRRILKRTAGCDVYAFGGQTLCAGE